jgi:flagellar motility protein MotE (MotC chaperone)
MRDKHSETLQLIGKERVSLDKDLLVFKGIELKNIKNLAVVYASMDASKSAKALRQLSSETGAKVLASMPAKKSAKVLEEIGPEVAAEISEQMKKLETVKKLSDEALKRRNLKALAGVYQRMEPNKTLAVLKELDDETSVNILSYMEEKKLAKILESMGAEEASELTEKIRKKSGMNDNIKKRQGESANSEGV